MHDIPDRGVQPPGGWSDAFARLPPEVPPAGAWQRVAASLDDRHRRPRRSPQRRAGWFALAATLALAVVLPWRQMQAPADGPTMAQPMATSGTAAARAPATTSALQAESALLETLVAHARDGRVASGSAAAINAELEARLAAIDSALADPALAPEREHALWRERVKALQALASFEGTRRWLAANGEQYDAALVQVN